MSDDNIIDTRVIGGAEYRVRLLPDLDCDSPRGLGHDAGRIVARSRRYSWPMEYGESDSIRPRAVADAVEDHPFRVVARWLCVFHGATVVLPLYATGPEGRPGAGDASDAPDAGNYIGVTFDQPSTRDATGIRPDQMASALATDVEEYSSWAVGEVYQYLVERKARCVIDEWEHVERSGAYIGVDYAEEEARHALDGVPVPTPANDAAEPIGYPRVTPCTCGEAQTATCGACHGTWCARCCPVPAARCPFEYEHPHGTGDGDCAPWSGAEVAELIELINEYGDAKFGDAWWPGNASDYLWAERGARLRELLDRVP